MRASDHVCIPRALHHWSLFKGQPTGTKAMSGFPIDAMNLNQYYHMPTAYSHCKISFRNANDRSCCWFWDVTRTRFPQARALIRLQNSRKELSWKGTKVCVDLHSTSCDAKSLEGSHREGSYESRAAYLTFRPQASHESSNDTRVLAVS